MNLPDRGRVITPESLIACYQDSLILLATVMCPKYFPFKAAIQLYAMLSTIQRNKLTYLLV